MSVAYLNMELNTTKYNYSEEVYNNYLLNNSFQVNNNIIKSLAEIDRKIPKQIGLFVTKTNRNFETRLKGDNL